MAAILTDMRRQDTRFPGKHTHFLNEFVGRTMVLAAGVFFIGKNFVANEFFHPFGNVMRLGADFFGHGFSYLWRIVTAETPGAP